MTTQRQKQRRALCRLFDTTSDLQTDFFVRGIKDQLPPEWDEIDTLAPVEPKKKKITLRIDEDVVRYFQIKGPGYQGQINKVLRTFVAGRVSHALRAREDGDSMDELHAGQRFRTGEELMEDLDAERAEKLAKVRKRFPELE